VIKDGVFVGDFEGMYQNFADPWHQSDLNQTSDSARNLTLNWCRRLSAKCELVAVELGCGFGHLTNQLNLSGIKAQGIDISPSAITKARSLYPKFKFHEAEFDNWALIEDINPDILILADITWYVLPRLEEFIKCLKSYTQSRKRDVFLIHNLTVYSQGVQKYGKDFFSTPREILDFFNLDYIESATITTKLDWDERSERAFFVAQI
jgi:SAM-dependent methyltransferase